MLRNQYPGLDQWDSHKRHSATFTAGSSIPGRSGNASSSGVISPVSRTVARASDCKPKYLLVSVSWIALSKDSGGFSRPTFEMRSNVAIGSAKTLRLRALATLLLTCIDSVPFNSGRNRTPSCCDASSMAK